jgi:hypothetical protein
MQSEGGQSLNSEWVWLVSYWFCLGFAKNQLYIFRSRGARVARRADGE